MKRTNKGRRDIRHELAMSSLLRAKATCGDRECLDVMTMDAL